MSLPASAEILTTIQEQDYLQTHYLVRRGRRLPGWHPETPW